MLWDRSEYCSYLAIELWKDTWSDIQPFLVLMKTVCIKQHRGFTIPSTMEAKFLHGIVVRTMLAFTQFGFGVRALLSDGASTNLSLMKILCGHEDVSTTAISPWFTSPYDGNKVYLIVCPSHQVRCLHAWLIKIYLHHLMINCYLHFISQLWYLHCTVLRMVGQKTSWRMMSHSGGVPLSKSTVQIYTGQRMELAGEFLD